MGNIENMTYEEVKRQIEEFKLLTKPNFWEIAGKPRSETAFSSYITVYDKITIGGKTYRISNQRTRNPIYLEKIKSVFSKKGYEIVSI